MRAKCIDDSLAFSHLTKGKIYSVEIAITPIGRKPKFFVITDTGSRQRLFQSRFIVLPILLPQNVKTI
jgi:hypothetical protein